MRKAIAFFLFFLVIGSAQAQNNRAAGPAGGACNGCLSPADGSSSLGFIGFNR